MSLIHDELTLTPGCYASIFLSERPLDPPGYQEAMEHVLAEARQIEGYLGFESLRNGRNGIFISYWRDAEAIGEWSRHSDHRTAKQRGVSEWYDAFRSVTCCVEQTRFFRRTLNPE